MKQFVLTNLEATWQPHQFGFIPNRPTGTTLALTSIRIWCMKAIDQWRGVVRLIAIDFRKAFDKVDHFILLKTARNRFRLPPAFIEILCSYLSDRWQKVTNASKWLPDSSIPQGSILGPFLFCMIMDSCNSVLANSKFVAYANDVTILHHVKPGVFDRSQEEIDNFCAWASSNKMVINVDKCAEMIIKRSETAYNFQKLCINGLPIKTCERIKLLGFHFESSLALKFHHEMVLKKCSQGMALVRQLRKTSCCKTSIKSAFYAFIFSHISYAWPCMVDMPKSLL